MYYTFAILLARNGKIRRIEWRQKMPKIEEILHDSKQLSLKQFALLCERMVEVEENMKKWKVY